MSNGRKTISFILAGAMAALVTGSPAKAWATIRYVNAARPDDSGNGLGWAAAKKTLQGALAGAFGGDEIWVAAGVYMPDQGGGQSPGNRSASFQLISNVAVYGGFASGETSLSQRNIAANPTILSGDLAGNDAPVACISDSECFGFGGNCFEGTCNIFSSNADNSFHVVSGSGSVQSLLDGFTIMAGNANGASPNNTGGGMYTNGGMPSVANCLFTRNFALNRGGGMYNSANGTRVTNCSFVANSCGSGGGGGMADHNNSTATVAKCTFRENFSLGEGGGLLSISNSTTRVFNCSFFKNVGGTGGGMAVISSFGPAVNCAFSGNSATFGGGLSISGSITLTNCTFSRNIATSQGGGIYTSGSSPTIRNSILWENSDAGGMDESAQFHTSGGFPVVNYSIVQGGWTGSSGPGNLASNPLLADANGPDNIDGTPDDDLALMGGSPAIDSANSGHLMSDLADLDSDGNTGEAIPIDLAGNPRQADDLGVPDTGAGPAPIVDMGAYEVEGPHVLYVDAGATGVNNGLSWTDAFMHPQSALSLASSNPAFTEIWVADGTYMPDGGRTPVGAGHLNGSGNRAATFQLRNGISIYGGFAGGETLLTDREPSLHQTVLSGDLLGNDTLVTCTQDVPDCDLFGSICSGNRCILPGNNSENSYHVVSGGGTDLTARLDGFTITSGRANGPGSFEQSGAGVLNVSGSPQLQNCAITRNTALAGGGVYNTNSGMAATNCTFRGNNGNGGGAMSNDASNSTITSCVFESNYGSGGGGLSNHQSSPRVTSCTFRGNRASFQGGAIYNMSNSSPTISECLFDKNRAVFGGGAVANANTSGTTLVVNCAFTGNFGTPGGGIFSERYLNVVNSAFSGNYSTSEGGGLYHSGTASFTLNNCTLSDNLAGTSGGGVYNTGDNSNDIFNSVFWNNSDSGGVDESAQIHTTTGTLEVRYSIVQGGWTGFGSNNLNSDPLFFDPDGVDNVVGTVDDNLRLLSGSPGINSGSNALVPADTADLDGDGNTAEQTPLDLPGGPRFLGTVDRGAYENFPDCNNNGIEDLIDIFEGTSSDCTSNGKSGNGIPDECDIADCPGSGICVGGPNAGDSCLIDFHCNGGIGCVGQTCNDCNLNGIPDGCDVFAGTSQDSNSDGFPDECGAFVGECAPPLQQRWTCPQNWLLGGQYPDDEDSVEGISVSLPNGFIVELDETVKIPSLWIQKGAELQMTTHDTLLDVDQAIQVDGTLTMESCRLAGNTPPILTIGPGGKFQTEPCTSEGPPSTMVAAEVRILGSDCFIPPCLGGGSVELDESISFASTGDLVIDGSFGGGSCDDQPLPGEQTPPSYRSQGSSTTRVVGTMYMLGAPQVFIASSVPVELGGNFENQSVRPDCFDWSGGLVMNGSTQEYEVAATDIGIVDFERRGGGPSQSEFTMGAVTIAAGSSVTFRDSFDNNLSGQGPCTEAVYIGRLTVEAGASMSIENCRVYYAMLSVDPSATVTLVGCAELVATPIVPPPQVEADASGINKTRFISFSVPESGGSVETALRVRLDSLHHVAPPYTGGPSVPFTSFEGQVRWVGPPVLHNESTSNPTPFYAANLQCAPYYQDWSTLGLLHVTGSAIVPSSIYEVENVGSLCQGTESNCTAVSAPLGVSTTRWGDVEAPYTPPDPGQPAFSDVSAMVAKFRSISGAPIKARALLAGDDAFGNLTTIHLDLSFAHIAACVDAFRGRPYPHTVAACP